MVHKQYDEIEIDLPNAPTESNPGQYELKFPNPNQYEIKFPSETPKGDDLKESSHTPLFMKGIKLEEIF